MASTGAPFIRLNRPRFAYRAWDDGCVVHDSADSTMYAFTAETGALLNLLDAAGGIASVQALAASLLGEPLTDEDCDLVQGVVDQLSQIGVVRPQAA